MSTARSSLRDVEKLGRPSAETWKGNLKTCYPVRCAGIQKQALQMCQGLANTFVPCDTHRRFGNGQIYRIQQARDS